MRSQISIRQKLRILKYLRENGNIKATARHFTTDNVNIQPSQIRRWKNQESQLKERRKTKPLAKTVHEGRKVENERLEKEVYTWNMYRSQH